MAAGVHLRDQRYFFVAEQFDAEKWKEQESESREQESMDSTQKTVENSVVFFFLRTSLAVEFFGHKDFSRKETKSRCCLKEEESSKSRNPLIDHR
jgi:hypothetical protein